MKNEIDQYIAAAPKAAQPHLREMRRLIRAAAPKAVERISYGMPAYSYLGRGLFGLAAWKKYVSIYPSGEAKGLERYKTHKATLSFPHDEPLPVAKITKLVRDRVKERDAAATVSQTAARARPSAKTR